MTMAVSSYRYQSRRSDEPLRTQLVELAREKPRFGYRRLHVLLGRSGEHVNHKRVHRVYRAAGLMIRRKKRKHCVREGRPLLARTSANQEWALDFLHDAVECGPGDPDVERGGCVHAGVFDRELVSKLIRCAAEDRGVADRVQRGTSAQQFGILYAERVCRGAGSELLHS
jgi:HTH-like domain